MKQIESIKVGVGGEILSAEVKTIKTVSAEQFCQIYLRDNEEFYKLSKAESNVLAVYYLNPEYFFKGKISDRTQIIKNIIEYKFIQ